MSDNSYPIYLTANTALGAVGDVSTSNTIADTSLSSLQLLRRGAKGYSEAVAEDMVHILENFANATAPPHALKGQIWFNTSDKTLYVNNSTSNAATFVKVFDGLASGLRFPINISLSGDATGTVSGVNLSSNVTIPLTLNSSGVVAGTYTTATIVVNSKGIVTQASSGIALSGSAINTALGYTAANDALVVHKAGDTMSGTLTIGSGGSLNVQSPGKVLQDGAQLVPRGVISMFYGSAAPTGWAICDGNNGTPDLRDRFVIGAGLSHGWGTFGGGGGGGTVSTSAVGDHAHGIQNDGNHSHFSATGSTVLDSSTMPAHTHPVLIADGLRDGRSSGQNFSSHTAILAGAYGGSYIQTTDPNPSGTSFIGTNSGGGGGSHNHSINFDGTHSHSGGTGAAGSHAHTVNIGALPPPPFCALYYIMKL